MREFAQFAGAMRFQIICGPVKSPIQATVAVKHARFAYGPYLAPPRRVRDDAARPGERSSRAA